IFGRWRFFSAREIEHGRFRALFADTFGLRLKMVGACSKAPKNVFPTGDVERQAAPWIEKKQSAISVRRSGHLFIGSSGHLKTNTKTKRVLPQKNAFGSGRRRWYGESARPATSWRDWRRRIRSWWGG